MRKYMKIASLVGLGLTASIMAFASPWGYGNHHNYDRAKIEAFMELPTEKQTLILDFIKIQRTSVGEYGDLISRLANCFAKKRELYMSPKLSFKSLVS